MDGISFNKKSLLEKYDSTPQENSENLVTSGTVYNYVETTKGTLEGEITNLTSMISSPFTFKGTSTYANLPASGNTLNDTYYVTDLDPNNPPAREGMCMYSWNGTDWVQSSMSQADYAGVIYQLKNDIADTFDAASTYAVGDVVVYLNDSKLYVCNTTIDTPHAFDSSEWDEIKIVDYVDNIVKVQTTEPGPENKIWLNPDPAVYPNGVQVPTMDDICNIVAPEYGSGTGLYNVGDYVIYNDLMYKCNTEITSAEVFDSNKWDQVSVTEELINVDNTLTIAGDAADAKTVGDVVGDINKALDNVITGSAFSWVIGALAPTTGNATNSTTRIRSEFIPVGNGANVTYTSANMAVYRYAADGSFLGYENWTTSYTVTSTVKFIRILLRKNSSNPDISEEDIAELVSAITIALSIPQSLYFSEPKIKMIEDSLSSSGLLIKPAMTDGKKVNQSGSLGDDSASSATDYIPVKEGYAIYLKNIFTTSTRGVIVYDADKNTLAVAAYNDNLTSLIYTIPRGGAYIRATARIENQVECVLLVKDTLGSYVQTILTETISPTYSSNGYVKYADGEIASSSTYKYSDPIYLYPGTLRIRGAATNAVAVLSSTNEIGDEYVPLVQGTTTDTVVYTYTITDEGYYCISYRIENGTPEVFLDRNTDKTILDNFHDIRSLEQYAENPTSTEKYAPAFTDGKYIAWNTGDKTSSANYRLSDAMYFPKGTLTVKAIAGSDVSVISKTNADETYFEKLVQGLGTSEAKTYTYQVTSPGYFCVSDRKSDSVEIAFKYIVNDRFDALEGIEQNLANSAELALYQKSTIGGNYTIKAFKTLNYSDGTLPKYSQVLWNDPTDDVYYVSANVHSDKTRIFSWNSTLAGAASSMYQAVILPNGDILFVYQTQFDHSSDATADGAYRKNPILYQAENGFTPVEIDFGDNLKPIGWLQNVGVHYSYTYNRLYISEYTRANEEYAHVWAVDMPVTDVSNWNVLLTKEVVKPYGDGFKHFHAAQEDPFTNILYFSSGDGNDSSQVWYSTDGATTALVALDDPNQAKYRMLNMAFTEDYVYWASDQWEPGHFLWKCVRDESTGVLDVENGLTKVLEFEDDTPAGQPHAWVATYATVYFPMFNALLFLDRDDHGEHASIPVRIYDIESGTLQDVATIDDITNGNHQFGFRNVAVLYYPKSNEVAVSYDANTPNYIKLLGNSGNNVLTHINNLVMRIYKDGTNYSMTFDTIY